MRFFLMKTSAITTKKSEVAGAGLVRHMQAERGLPATVSRRQSGQSVSGAENELPRFEVGGWCGALSYCQATVDVA